jgi:hypothetical protein
MRKMSYENLQEALKKKYNNGDLKKYCSSPKANPASNEYTLANPEMNLAVSAADPLCLSNLKSPPKQQYDESFACKSVEITHTKTVMSRNNTHVEVY